MITFRASGVGHCVKEIVHKTLHPEAERFDPFLRAGHDLQHTLNAFMSNIVGTENRVTDEEPEGELLGTEWDLTGHCDGWYPLNEDNTKITLLEYKAIKDESFQKLQDTNDFRSLYPQYYDQVQAYMELEWPFGWATQANMVFYNRNTGQIMSPYVVDQPWHTTRRDLRVEHDQGNFGRMCQKLDTAARYIRAGQIPECDKQGGYCFFCEKYRPGNPAGARRTVEMTQSEHQDVVKLLKEYRAAKKHKQRLLNILDNLDADMIRLTGKRNLLLKRWELI